MKKKEKYLYPEAWEKRKKKKKEDSPYLKIKLCSSNDFLRSLNVYDSLPRNWVASFLLISNKAFWWSSGQGMKRSIYVSHILQSQKPDPIEKTGHTIRLRCACVWNFF